MQNAWRVVDCTNLKGFLRYVRGRVSVCDDDTGQVVDIPLAQTAVLLIGLHCHCSAGVLHQCAVFGTSVMICDWRGVPLAALHSWANPATRATARQLAQAALPVPRRKQAWAKVVRAKIQGQAACLDALQLDGGGQLRGYAHDVRSGDATNREGLAARAYWACLFGKSEGFHRIPSSGEGRNALLDYAYMVLRGFAIKAVLGAGLSPVLGMNHHNGVNYYCLADDVIEVFRPAIDFAVARLPRTAEVTDKAVKRTLIEAVNQQFGEDGLTIPSALMALAQSYGVYVEKLSDEFIVPQFTVAAARRYDESQ